MNKEKLSLRLYQLLILLLTPVLVIVFLLRSINHKEYRQRLSQRFGWVPSYLKPGGIIVHAASVGEVIAAKPFIEQLLIKYPDLPITVTTFTPTGSAQVVKSFSNRVQHCYLPLDISFCVHLFFKLLKPKAVVLMETELWPTLIQRCYKSNVKLLLINARLSAKSLKSYKKLSWLISPTLNKFSAILCQSEDNAQHFIEMGAKPDLVTTSGNLKYDIAITKAMEDKVAELKEYIDTTRKLLVVGSTHQGEEQQMLAAYKQLKIDFPDLLMAIVPRHPERFSSVVQLCQAQGFNTVERSSKQKIEKQTDVWVIDTLGELFACYALSDICIVAGSFSDIGGHNPLEPALFAKPIIVGTNMANFKDMNAKLLAANGIVQLSSNDDLARQIDKLLNDASKAKLLGENALSVVLDNQGATQKTVERLASLINS
ncbi:lipid IV(A) 3-deoxy-D-manno-octulosonic acid transferase [Thalassomonas sp. M1454]|uniref:lipid IV(A) 3-deoxy-D-manno-octulosonic acid transferase n=1 Tax=Thalassomonas sp. M1454 TaxID=2594477 RepID=UPI00117BF9E0|nr:lipid IV(A) 3-deoxy-D-manno-octulosonic acid transferase [Thalassomonas sp. M1454]TRX55202.1 3-deoxy-D-manno-octulosonic acid transferase [Thalassomonas sp. M1454]